MKVLSILYMVAGLVLILCGFYNISTYGTKEELIQKGREEILTGKVICVLDKMEEDKPKFNCKSKEEFNKDIEFLLKSGVLKKKEGSAL